MPIRTGLEDVENFVGSFSAVSEFPLASEETNNLIYLDTVDGLNQIGFYLSNGSSWVYQDFNLLRRVEIKTTDTTVSLVDNNSLLYNNSGTAILVTLPSDATENLPIGFQVAIGRASTGTVTFEDDSGSSTIISEGGLLEIADAGIICTAIKVDSDTWWISGKLI